MWEENHHTTQMREKTDCKIISEDCMELATPAVQNNEVLVASSSFCYDASLLWLAAYLLASFCVWPTSIAQLLCALSFQPNACSMTSKQAADAYTNIQQ